MPLPKNSDAINRIRAGEVDGLTNAAAAKILGCSAASVSVYRAMIRAGGGKAEAPTPEVKKAAAEFAEAAGYHDDWDESPEAVWRRAEKDSARRIRKLTDAGTLKWAAPGPHVLLTMVSDQHIAPGTPVDFRQMRLDAELIRDTPHCYALLGGDAVDNHIKHRSAVMAARSQPSDQYELFRHYLSILKNKALLMVSGNHDNWTNQFAGVDALDWIAKEKRVFYNPDAAHLELRVGGQEYGIAIRHQYKMNSSYNQTHSVKQWLRMGERDFDIGTVCHHHEHALESFVWRGRVRWACRPGSYQISSAYSRQFGWNQSMPTCPTFLLRGDRREIYGFDSLRAAVDAVGALRAIGVGQ